jgi:crotonobetainyl-CoA:carnitine CoA-transferase CaiB-like acyl-CoA transferase
LKFEKNTDSIMDIQKEVEKRDLPGIDQILKGIRVIEAATMVFVPSAAAIMADFGAEVIKVEAPGGGDLHRYGHQLPGMPESEVPYVFQVDNRNKKSVVLNLKEEEGQKILRKLITTADVFLTSYRSGALKKLKMTYEDFQAINPKLIYGYGSGYGEQGPEANKPGYDMVCYWSRSGIEGQVFPMNDWLGPIPYGSGDHPSGMTLLTAIMFALYAREKTGKGTRVSTSLLACGAWANSNMIQGQLCGARFRERVPREQSYNFTFIYYTPKDGRPLKLNIYDHEKDLAPFCQAVGRPDLIDNPLFATGDVRVKHMSELIAIFDEAFAQQDLAYWAKTLSEHDIPFTVISNYEEIDRDPQMAATGVFTEVDHPRYGRFRTVDSPFKIEGQEKVKPGGAPELGEHTEEVLRALGYPEERIQDFLDRGIAVQNPGASYDAPNSPQCRLRCWVS